MDRRPVDLIVHGGRVCLPNGEAHTAVAVRGEKIVAIGDPDALPRAERYIDATGMDVLPGIIDAHSHTGFDDWASLTEASAYGGVTTTITFVGTPADCRPLAETIREQIDSVQHRSVDVAFHAFLFPKARPLTRLAIDLADAVELGVGSFKMFMAYPRDGQMCDDGFIFRACQTLARLKAMPMVHAENGPMIDAIEDDLIAAGHVAAEFYHDSRPPAAEAEAVARAAHLAETAGSPLYIVHLSTGAGLAVIRARRAAGQHLYAETCPQYLALSDDHLLKRGAFAKIAPPMRRAPDIGAMWSGLTDGAISVVSSDHSPHDPELKAKAGDNIFRFPDGQSVPFGAPGAETLLPVLYSEAVVKRGFPLSWLGRVMSENPARLFGLYPRKGVIFPGSDADLTIVDPRKRVTIAAEKLHSMTGYTIFDGVEAMGWPAMTLIRGNVVLDNGALHQHAGGTYISAGPHATALSEHIAPLVPTAILSTSTR